MTAFRKISYFAATAALSVFVQPALAQELNDLNLPQSGLTESGLQSRDELLARMMQLTTCAECSMIIGGKTYYGSDDYINFGIDNVSVVLNGYSVRFERFSLDGDVLPGCQNFVSGKIASGPSGMADRWIDESLAFTFTGAQASLAGDDNVIALQTDITWPENPMSADFPAKLFVGGENTVLLPYSGRSGDELVTKINELSQVCEALGWQ